MPRNEHQYRAYDHLDLIRGLAAVAVLVYHVRYRFFFDYSEVIDKDLPTAMFYAATAFGHDAVIVFFVLSGFFIGSSILSDLKCGSWSWRRYLVNRTVRLYVVLIPGLLLTLAWDGLGLSLYSKHPTYSGEAQSWVHDFYPVIERLTFRTMAANFAFLQTIVAPPFGSNGPLWSLAFEFWYYIIFPFIALACCQGTRRWRARFGFVVAAGLLLWFCGVTIAAYFPIWSMGVAIALLPRMAWIERHCGAPLTIVAAICFLTMLAASHSSRIRELIGGSVLAADYLNAMCFSFLLWIVLHDRTVGGGTGYARWVRELASMSYTLYVVHYPVLVFARAWVGGNRPWEVSSATMVGVVILSSTCMAYAWSLARLFEARTDLIRRRLLIWSSAAKRYRDASGLP